MCGIVGLASKRPEEQLIGLPALSVLDGEAHRGKASAGIVTYGPLSGLEVIKGLGPVGSAIPISLVIKLWGLLAIGQVRYSTTGSEASKLDKLKFLLGKLKNAIWKRNAQPFYLEGLKGKRALIHNGNLTNAHHLKKELKAKAPNLEFHGESDTEVILVLISYYIEYENLSSLEAIKKAMSVMKGGYSCILLTKEGLFAFRDPLGFRPLEIGENEDYIIFASEPCAWHNLKAKQVGSVNPGEIVEVAIGTGIITRHQVLTSEHQAICLYCYYYFMALYNPLVKRCRDLYGQELFAEHPLSGLIVPMMESGLGAALGYHGAQALDPSYLGIFDIPMPKDPNVGRSFLESTQAEREEILRIKYYYLFDQIGHKIRALATKLDVVWIIVVDDSLIRGTVAKAMILLIREIIQKEFPDLADRIKIAWLTSASLYKHPCYMGLDTYKKISLIAHRVEQELKARYPQTVITDGMIIEEIRKEIGADYLGMLSFAKSLQITAQVLGVSEADLCQACITGKYPIDIDPDQDKQSCE